MVFTGHATTFAILETKPPSTALIKRAKIMKTRRYKHGLSLVEMLIVVGIIALLATMVIGIAGHIDTQAKERGVKSTFVLLEGALDEYKEFQGVFPAQLVKDFTNVSAHSEYLYGELYSIPGSRKILGKVSGSLIKHDVDTGIVPPIPEIYDPWGTPLDYRYAPGDNFPELISAGPDRIFGNNDDITNR
jgi:prepilin-type N-terminal cleavage/methylation domain-containing protein